TALAGAALAWPLRPAGRRSSLGSWCVPSLRTPPNQGLFCGSSAGLVRLPERALTDTIQDRKTTRKRERQNLGAEGSSPVSPNLRMNLFCAPLAYATTRLRR